MRSSKRPGIRQYNKSDIPRLRWTPELHQHFVEAVKRLGGKHRATPKRILEMMSVKGLKISHVKSHLQMYRSTKDINNANALISTKQHLRPKQAHLNGIGMFCICSPQRPLGDESRESASDEKWDGTLSEESNGLPKKNEEEVHENEQQEWSDISFIGSKSKEEDAICGLTESCELSLSFTPPVQKDFWPITTDQRRHFRSTEGFINIPEFLPLGSNHLNLDLTI